MPPKDPLVSVKSYCDIFEYLHCTAVSLIRSKLIDKNILSQEIVERVLGTALQSLLNYSESLFSDLEISMIKTNPSPLFE